MSRKKGKAQLTRAVLASELSDLLHLPRGKHGECPEASRVVKAIFHVIIEALLRGEEVRIQGLGTFKVRLNKPTHFPHTIERKFNGVRAKYPIPRRKVVRFYPSKEIGYLS